MKRKQIEQYAHRHEPCGRYPEGLDDWHLFSDFFEFLAHTTTDCVPIYSSGAVFLDSVLVPEPSIAPPDVDDLMQWQPAATLCWSFEGLNDEDSRNRLCCPLEYAEARTLRGGEPVFTLREFPGVMSYVELNQRISHATDLHWMENRSSYCQLDENGDFVDLAIVRKVDNHFVCTVESSVLHPYMALSGQALIRLFDVFRGDLYRTLGAAAADCRVSDDKTGIYARHLVWTDDDGNPVGAKIRGFQIVRTPLTSEVAIETLERSHEPEDYAVYTIYDWRHDCVRKCSCAPGETGSYFTDHDLPYETSPAFFRSEVLGKYKNDPDRYTLTPDYISCRGGWWLRYDINEEYQVHAYLCDLRMLPYREQLYWQSCNEEPKGSIARRAFRSDFLAQFSDEYDPVVSLKQLADDAFPRVRINGREITIWEPDEQSAGRLAYLPTESKKDWEDAILNLAKFTVDGLAEKSIRRLAQAMGCEKPKWRSIKLLKACLIARELDDESICAPLQEVWGIRSHEGVAHRGTSARSDTREHYRRLMADCDCALRTLGDIIHQGYLDFPQAGPIHSPASEPESDQ